MQDKITYAREVGYNVGMDYCDTLIYKVRGPRKGRRALGKPTTEAQAVVNERHARMHLSRLANANFESGRDLFVHLTFDKGYLPATRLDCKHVIDLFLRRVKRAYAKRSATAWEIRENRGKLLDLRYLYVIEGSDGKRLHAHMLMTAGLSWQEIKALWGMAEIIDVDVLQAGQKGYEALSVYLTKQGKLASGEHRWYGSRNLVKPDYEERNARMAMDEAEELGDYIANRMPAEGDEPTDERYAPIEERYPDYYCAEAEAKYLETFREWVIHIQLYRKDTEAGVRERNRRKDEAKAITARKAILAAFAPARI